MKFKNNKIIFVLIFLIVLTSLPKIIAEEDEVSPLQEILNNPDKFNPSEESQTKVLINAYSNGKIDLDKPNHKKAIGKYLAKQSSISSEDRKMFNDFVSNDLGPKISVDLTKGERITLEEKDGKYFLVTDDKKEHDLALYSTYDRLDKIISNDDGLIELIFGEDSVSLKDTTFTQTELNKFLLSDGTIINLENRFGKLVIEGREISCQATRCPFKIGEMEIELKLEGRFANLGGNKFDIVNGNAWVGKHLVSGSAVFSTNQLKTNLNLKKKINARTFLSKSAGSQQLQKTPSYVIIDASAFGESITVNTVTAERNVIACFDCNDLDKTRGNYDGYVHLTRKTGISDLAFSPVIEMKGLQATKIGNKASFEIILSNLS